MNKRLNLKSILFFEKKINITALFLIVALFQVQANEKSVVGEKIIINSNKETIQNSISGTITDDLGDPLPGANIIEKGTANGVQTDFDGNFTMQVANDAILVISYVGFATEEIPVSGESKFNVQLKPSSEGLDEVVVIGYGTVRKSDLTGSVSSITTESIESRPLANIADVFQGNSSGVAVNSASGAPGSSAQIRIRGIGSINSTIDPLIVVNGLPYDGDLNSINPYDIESIEILKDASSTAIYGSRGSNGVVLITTKRGSASKLEVGYNTTIGTQRVIREIDVLNSQQFAELRNDIASNDGLELPFPVDEIAGLPNTNWQDVFFRDAVIQTHQLYARGGSEKVRFYMSANYVDQEGIAINSSFKKGTITANVDANISDKFSIGNSLTISRQLIEGVDAFGNADTNAGFRNIVSQALNSSPVVPAFDDEGNISDVVDESNNQVNNPLFSTLNIQDEFINQTLGSIYLKYELTDWLSAKTTFGFNLRDIDEGIFISSRNVGSNGGSATRSSLTSNNWVSTTQLDFNKVFNKHSVNAVVVGEFQKFSSSEFEAVSQTFVLDNLTFNSLQSGSNPQIPSSESTSNSIASFLGRVNYVFDNKYFLTASGRYDGSSRLSDINKWNFFPSFAAKWKISNEDFMSSVDFIDDFNLGVSYGETGSQSVESFQTLALLASDQAIIGENSDINIGFAPENFPNRALTWEISQQLDYGIDFSLLNGRFNVEASYFTKDTEGLFFNRALPAVVGTNQLNTVTNIGSINNKGVEIDINATVVSTEDFSWNINANFTTVKNRVVALAENDTISSGLGGVVDFGFGSQLIIEGQRLGHFFGLQTDGLYDDDVSLTFNNSPRLPGDRKYVDTNGDGNISVDDRVFLGNAIPDKFWGLTSTWNYKGISLSVFLQGSHGNKIANYTKYSLDNISRSVNSTTDLLDRWTPQNTDTNIPRASIANQTYTFGDDLLEDGDYVRLKTITLGYKFPSDIINKIKGINSVNLYATGTNLLTFTEYTGINPDITSANGALNAGYDFNVYPAAKSVVVGLNIGF